jgi:murein DD-endopeptidase MepM/ murein hydrolase activator NlpD
MWRRTAAVFFIGFASGIVFLGLLIWRGRAWKPEAVAAASTSAAVTDAKLRLLIPVQGVTAAEIRDNFEETHSGHRHEALDIMAPRGTPVLAADDGVIAKLFFSKAGGLTIYQFDDTREYCYYYAHLDRYADDAKEGVPIMRGQILGYVGTTGNAPPNAPHLHFTIFKLGPEKHWWRGTAINPYPYLVGKPD